MVRLNNVPDYMEFRSKEGAVGLDQIVHIKVSFKANAPDIEIREEFGSRNQVFYLNKDEISWLRDVLSDLEFMHREHPPVLHTEKEYPTDLLDEKLLPKTSELDLGTAGGFTLREKPIYE